MHLVEQIGSGVNRMNNLITEAGLPQPEIHTEGMFSVPFRRSGKASEKTVEKTITELIQRRPKVTTKKMIKATGLTRRGVEYNLNKLKNNGIIERIGPDKGGYRQLTTNRNP